MASTPSNAANNATSNADSDRGFGCGPTGLHPGQGEGCPPGVSYFSGFLPLAEGDRLRLLAEAHPRYLTPQSSTSAPSPQDAVVICLHGFSGMPYEVYPALEAIAQRGLAACCPLLPRHGYRDPAVQHREFAQLQPGELLRAVRCEIAQARQQYRRVGLMGFSMGGAIALTLAAEGLVDACAVIAPALRLPLKGELLIPLLGWADFEVAAPSTEPFHFPKYSFHHARALRTLWQIAAQARRGLGQIACPLQVIQSQGDRTIPPRVVGLIERRVPGPIEVEWFQASGHLMLLDCQSKAVAAVLSDFFERQLAQERPGEPDI